MMTEAERIIYLIQTLEHGNSSAFAEKVGMSKPHLFKLRKGLNGIRLQIPKICKAYPQISRAWLESGDGYPGDLTIDLVKMHYEHRINRANAVIDNLNKRINELENQLNLNR